MIENSKQLLVKFLQMQQKYSNSTSVSKQVQDTLVIIKPETIKRRLVGRILQTFEDAGYEIAAMKLVKTSETAVKKHYLGSKKWRISVGNKVINVFNDNYDVQEVLGTADAFKIGTNILNWSINELTRDRLSFWWCAVSMLSAASKNW